jgi:flavorubredoxin
MRAVQNSFKEAIRDNNNTMFMQVVESGLIDPQKHKKEILDYYFAHASDLNATGTIKKLLDENKELKAKQARLRKRALNKKQREEEKIKRIREKDRLEHAKLEKKLDEAVERKKIQIRKEQKEELIKSI